MIYVEPHEIGYLALGLIGVTLTLLSVVGYAGDVVSLYRQKVNGARRALAWLMLRNEIEWLLVNMLMLVSGLNAVATEPRPFTTGRVIVTIIFYGVTLYSVIASLMNQVARGKVIADLATKRIPHNEQL